MGELVWSLADTHCVWCGKPKATEADSARHDNERPTGDCTDEEGHWCLRLCWGDWGNCENADGHPEDLLAGLRALVEAQASVIARLRDGWLEQLWIEHEEEPTGYWWDPNRPVEPMTDAEQIVLFGEVVRTEEADRA